MWKSEMIIDQENEILDRIIRSRRSVRNFTDETPSRELLEQVIEAGRQAPFAGLANRGTVDFRHFFIIPRGSKSLDLLRAATKEAVQEKLSTLQGTENQRMQNMLQAMRMIAEKGLPPWNAPWLVIVAERRGFPAREPQSLGHCLQNMWLKATALGLGLGLASAISDLSDSPVLSQILHLPLGEYCLEACQIGYPATPPRVLPREEPASSLSWLE
jgi:nitroreductase